MGKNRILQNLPFYKKNLFILFFLWKKYFPPIIEEKIIWIQKPQLKLKFKRKKSQFCDKGNFCKILDFIILFYFKKLWYFKILHFTTNLQQNFFLHRPFVILFICDYNWKKKASTLW